MEVNIYEITFMNFLIILFLYKSFKTAHNESRVDFLALLMMQRCVMRLV